MHDTGPMPATASTLPAIDTRVLATAVALAAITTIAGALGALYAAGWQWLHWIGKPLATLLIVLAAAAARPLSPRYRRWIVSGLGFSLLGDVLLMLPHDLFVPGLVAFLFAHLCYLVALADDTRLAAHPLSWLACLGVGALNLWLLWLSLMPALRPAVVVYVLVLAAMAGQAVGRAWHHARLRSRLRRPAWRAAAGALLFMLSDSLLAWDRFHAALPLASLWILASYYAAQWLLARSVQVPAAESAA